MFKKITTNPFARNSLVLFAGSAAGNFLNYLFHFVVGRMASVSVYGEAESLISFVNIITVPVAALAMIATKYGAICKAENDPAGNRRFMEYLNRKTALIAFPVFLLCLVLTPWAANFFHIPSAIPLIMVWAMLFISFFSSINGGTLIGWQKFAGNSWSGIIGSLVKLLSVIILISLGMKTGGVMGAFLLGSAASYLATLFFLRFIVRDRKGKEKPKEEKYDFKSFKKYIPPVFFCNLALTILANADMVIAKHNIDAVSSGEYGALTIISKIIFFITGVSATVLFSMSSEKHHKKENSMSLFRQALFWTFVLSIAALGLYFLNPRFIMGIFFGDKYFAAASHLGYLAVAVVLFSFTNLIAQYLLSKNQTGFSYILLVFSFFFIAALLFWGRDISAIIKTTVLVQLVALAISLGYLYKNRKWAYITSEIPVNKYI